MKTLSISILFAVAGFAVAAEPDFAPQAGAFLAKYCTDCHGADVQEAGLNFAGLPHDLDNADTSAVWRRILEQVLFSEMPPEDSADIPNSDERAKFVDRMETGLGEKDKHGRRMLSPHELVYAIQYAFQNKPAYGVEEFASEEAYRKQSEPVVVRAMTEQNRVAQAGNSWLVDRMRAGNLKTRDDVEQAVREMLGGRPGNLNPNHNSPIESVKNPRILQFFREYFGYHKAPSVFKDVDKFATQENYKQFHGHSAVEMMYGTDALILHILEAFNHVGRFRTLEKDKPVDTSGEIAYSGVEGLDGQVGNAREMMERLARSPRVRQSFLRHMIRCWMGRNEMLSDSPTLIAADRAYVEGGGSFKSMVVALLTSDSFLYRK